MGDPLRLSDGASDEQLHRWRCVELKHGRVAMAATVGYLYNDLQLNFPGDLFRRYSDPAERETKLISELKNGRLAMMGIMGMLVTDQLTGMGPISWLIKDGSPFGVVGSKLTF